MRPRKSRAHISGSPAQKRGYLPTSPSINAPLSSTLVTLRINESRNDQKGQRLSLLPLTRRPPRRSDVRLSSVSPVSQESDPVSAAISTVTAGHSQKNHPKITSQQAKTHLVTGSGDVTTLPPADHQRRSSIRPIRTSQGFSGPPLPETGPDPYFKHPLDGNTPLNRSRSQARNANGRERTDIFAHIQGQSTPNHVRRPSQGSLFSESAFAANDAGTRIKRKRTQPKAAKGHSPSNYIHQERLLSGRNPAEHPQQGKELSSSCSVL